MQYILSEEEYKAFKQKQEFSIKLSKEKLQALCIKIADTMPVKWGWDKLDIPKAWGCYITVEKEHGDEWYCDTCPVQKICPLPHHYSK